MFRLHLPIIIALVICSCSSKRKVETPKFPSDQKLRNSWESFRQAVNAEDTSALISVSTSCIVDGDFYSPDSPRIISAKEFYSRHFRDFRNDVVPEMNDSTKIWAAYDEYSTWPERDSCLSISSPGHNRLAEVSVSVGERDGESLSVLIFFVRIDSTYKFYGISRMP